MKRFIVAVVLSSILLSMFACGKQTESPPEDTLPPDNAEFDYAGIDHIIEIPEGQDITILQLTDTQVMLYEGIRTRFFDEQGNRYVSNGRFEQVHNAFFSSGITDTYTRVWQYVEEGVKRANPDIIVLTGDNIYGETDDDGFLWLEMIDFLDSFEIPWLCTFGNHDNESHKGVHWQIEAIENSKFGYIKEGSLQNGNSNYTVGIKQGDSIKHVLYFLDTNGCCLKPHNFGEGILPYNPDLEDIQQVLGIYPDQMEWMRECNKSISAYANNIPSMIFMHIPPVESYTSIVEKYGDTYGVWPFYPNKDFDFGMALEGYGGFDSNGEFIKVAKEIGCVGMFVGHQHNIATSTMCDGIRLTYGLKTGTGDYHDPNMIGTTKITISEADNSFEVEYLHSELEYPLPLK